MFRKFYQSKFTKSLSLIMALSVLTMSFNAKKYEVVTLPGGTYIGLETAHELNSEFLIPGQSIDFFVKNDIQAEGKTVIKRGAIARGQVLRVQRAKGLGKEGFVEVEIKSVEAVDGSEVFLTGARMYEAGDDRQTLSIVLGVLVCILFLIMKGENAVIPAGYSVDGRIAQDVQINVE